MHEPILRNNPALIKKLIFPYIIFLLSMLVLVIGFTSLRELIHSLKSNYSVLKIYWIKVINTNFFIWIVSFMLTIFGVIACKKSFYLTKETWNEVIENIKLSLVK